MAFLLVSPLPKGVLAATAADYLAAGNQLYGAKNYDQAIRYYQAVLQLEPNSAAAFQGLGTCYYQQEDRSKALEAFKQAARLDPQNTRLLSFVQNLETQANALPVAPPQPLAKPAARSKEQWFLTGGSAFAQEDVALGFGGGFNLPLGPEWEIGLGGQMNLFVQPVHYTLTSRTTSEVDQIIDISTVLKYKFPGEGLRPYLLGGGGIGLQDVAAGSSITTYNGSSGYPIPPAAPGHVLDFGPMVTGGLGCEFTLGGGTNFILEVRACVIFRAGIKLHNSANITDTLETGSYLFVPVNAGIDFDL